MKYLVKYPFIAIMFVFIMCYYVVYWVGYFIWNLKVAPMKPMEFWKMFVEFGEGIVSLFTE